MMVPGHDAGNPRRPELGRRRRDARSQSSARAVSRDSCLYSRVGSLRWLGSGPLVIPSVPIAEPHLEVRVAVEAMILVGKSERSLITGHYRSRYSLPMSY